MSSNTILLTSGCRKLTGLSASTSTIKPGMLLELASASTLKPHALAGGEGEAIIAYEDSLQGKTKDDTYADTEVVLAAVVKPGEEVQGILAAGENVAVTDLLMSAGNGKVKKYTASPASGASQVQNKALFKPLAALNLSASGAVDTLIEMRKL